MAFLGLRGIPARYGGFETFVEELAPRLVQRGVDVTVFCEHRRGPRPAEHLGVQLRYVRAWAPGPARTLQFDVACLRRAAREFDVVYLLGCGAAFALQGALGQGARLWVNPGGLEWRRSKWGPLARRWLLTMEREACAAADRVVFDNAALAQDVIGRHGVRSSATIPYGAYVLADAPLGPPAPELPFGLAPQGYDLVVCRFEPENQVRELVEAHRRAAQGVPLVLVMNEPSRAAYGRAVRRAAGPEARFVGPIYDPAVLQPLRRGARLHLHGHTVGGTNPTLLEAMGAGNFVLAADNPFNREVLGENGVYWADVAALETALAYAGARSIAGLAALGAANAQRVREHYGWDRIADLYRALLDEELGLAASVPCEPSASAYAA